MPQTTTRKVSRAGTTRKLRRRQRETRRETGSRSMIDAGRVRCPLSARRRHAAHVGSECLAGRRNLLRSGGARRQMKVFGYEQPADEKPFLRLACRTRANGNVTLVIPPWNAVFGKKVYDNIEAVELEPVTTSAKALRETVKAAVKG